MVVVIGGGASGLGVAWDLLLRGIPTTVVEQGDVGGGTSGRFHGLLHSGARYVVVDPVSARHCIAENAILRVIAAAAIKAVPSYFVSVDDDGDRYLSPWLDGMNAAGIGVREVPLGQVISAIPDLNRQARRAFSVPDAVLEGFTLLRLLRDNITQRGGTVLTHSQVTQVHQVGGVVSGVTVSSRGAERLIVCDAVVNAAGPGAGQIVPMFGDQIEMQLSAGMMLVFANRRVGHIVNRLGPPGDGDILVPHGRTAILGTTDIPHGSPQPPVLQRQEAVYLLEQGERLFPRIASWRALRAFSGVRPLFSTDSNEGASVRRRIVTRDFTVLDHGMRGGVKGAFTIIGGKWTTYRLMAERTVDAVCRHLDSWVPSRTAVTPLTEASSQGDPVGAIVCECEGVTLDTLHALNGDMDTWRTRAWFAMGPCQGAICLHRGAAIRQSIVGVQAAMQEFLALRRERWRGVEPVAWGDNAREWALTEALRHQTLAEEGMNGR